MSRPLARVATAASLGAVLFAAACGGSSGGGTPANPKAELLDGVQSLQQGDAVTATIKLDTDAATLQDIGKKTDSPLSSDAANAIASSQLVIQSKGHGSGGSGDFRVIVSGKPLFDLRSVGKTIYLQGDVQGVLALMHKSQSYAQLQAQTAQMPTFVKAFLAGKWVSIDSDALTGLASVVGGANPAPSSSPGTGNQVLAQLKSVLQRDVSVTRKGSDSRGDHLVLTGDVQQIGKDVQKAIKDSVPGGSALGDQLSTQNTPPRTVTVDAWVKDGSLAEISIDLTQFDDSGKIPAGDHVPVTVTFQPSAGDVSAPSGAVPVDLTQLGALANAVSPSTSGASFATG